MAKQVIGIGTAANDGTGDTLRDAMNKTNENFTELYTTTTSLTNDKADIADLISVFLTARNNTGSTITKGKAVYISGAVGQNPTIALARSNSETTTFDVGISNQDIANNTNVQNNVTITGLISDVDTSAFVDGDKLYLSSSVAGGLQNTSPSSPNFGMVVGFCLYSHAVNGKILVAPERRPVSQNTTLDTSRITVPSNNVVKTNIDLKTNLVNAATVITNAATMDLASIKNTLTSSSATRTFTISYTGDDITLEVTLNAISATYTFPVTSLCISEGMASGNNTLSLSGVSGDKYIITIKKIGTAYYVASRNYGQ